MSILFRGISEISVRKALQAQHAISLFSHTTSFTSYRKNLFLMFFYITKDDSTELMVILTIPYVIKDVLDERRRITCFRICPRRRTR